MVSPRTAYPLAKKYALIPITVSHLDPIEVGKHAASNPLSFFPSTGLFSIEFALGYCNNMHYGKRNESAPSVINSNGNNKK
jgi:hypothetical protein